MVGDELSCEYGVLSQCGVVWCRASQLAIQAEPELDDQ
jgi:hypothetical protein